MLNLTIKAQTKELFDSETNEFKYISLEKDQTLCLEHSLVSVSKWEAKWHIPFLSKKQKTEEQLRDYIKCMTISQNIDPIAYEFLSEQNFIDINNYIEDPMTASKITNNSMLLRGNNGEYTSSEIIYYWMISLEIPFECQKWHLNRLLTLVRICNAKNNPGEKMSKKDVYAQNRALNQARRNRMKSRG